MNFKKIAGFIIFFCSISGIFIFYNLERPANVASKPAKEATEKLPIKMIEPMPYKTGQAVYISNAKAIKAVDLGSNYTFIGKNQNEKLPIASLTKVMTALVVMENSKRTEVATVPQINMVAGEAKMGLIPGEKLKVEELLKGVLIHSAGDAAEALSIHVAGNEPKFVELMNKKANDLMLKDTHFSNPVGLDDTQNYSTANDLTNLTRVILRNKDFREIIKTNNYTAKNESGRTYYLQTTNKILDNSRIFGVKTGYTLQAGECLITLAEQDNHEILITLIGSPDRFGETRNLVNWIYTNFSW